MRQEQLKAPPTWINLAAWLTRRVPVARGRIVNRVWHNSDRRFLARMASQLGGFAFDCCLGELVDRNVFLAEIWAQHEVALMRATLKAGMKFVDVGAHWGLLTMFASHLVGTHGQVIALEPDPRLCAKLRFHLELNAISNVAPVEAAAADRNADLILTGYEEGQENWSRLIDHVSQERTTFTVKGKRLDDLLDEIGVQNAIDLVKIDVEGAEDLVLQGMEAGLGRQRYKRILLELHPAHLSERSRTISDIVDFLGARGYRGYTLNSSAKEARRAYYHPWRPIAPSILPSVATSDTRNLHFTPHTVWTCPGLALF